MKSPHSETHGLIILHSYITYWFFPLQSETKDEVAALQKESEVPLDELLESLPKEILEKPASLHSETDETDKVCMSNMH